MYGIAEPIGHKVLVKKGGRINDIVKKITSLITARTELQVKEFAKQFSKDRDGLFKLWQWVKANIRYVEDGNKQIIKDPASLVSIGAGDCKSMTLFVASVVECMGLDFIIQYVHYRDIGTNHVYCTVILENGEKVIVDTVWHRFNEQKEPYEILDIQHFKNKKAMDLYTFSGVGRNLAAALPFDETINEDIENALSAIEQAVADIPDSVLINDITEMSKGEAMRFLTGGTYKVQSLIESNEPAFSMPNIVYNGENVGGIFTKIGDAIKNAFKKIVNWIFKEPLKKAAPFFLFIFSKTNLGHLGIKKERQEKWLTWLAKITGSTEATIKTTIAAEIQKQTGQTPEQLLRTRDSRLAGFHTHKIGFAVAAISSAITAIVDIVGKIVNLFKKKDNPDLNEQDGSVLTDIPVYVPEPDAQQPDTDSDDEIVIPNGQSNSNGGRVILPPSPIPTPSVSENNNTALLIAAALAAFVMLK